MTTFSHLKLLREIVLSLLAYGPLKGALLKPLVVRQFERVAGEPYAVAFRAYPKFVDALRTVGDELVIDAPPGTDMTVRLNNPVLSESVAAATARQPELPARLQAGIWVAFTNPDPQRRRFFYKSTGRLVHFVVDAPPAWLNVSELLSDPDAIEIKPTTAAEQQAWARRFVQEELPAQYRPFVEPLVANAYASATNNEFKNALGPHLGAWQHFRTLRMIEKATEWAARHGISFNELLDGHHAMPPPITAPASTLALVPAPTTAPSQAPALVVAAIPSASIAATTRQRLHQLIDAMTESELAQVMVPASVVARVIDSTNR